MTSRSGRISALVVFALLTSLGFSQAPEPAMSFTVSLDPPAHLFHVVLNAGNLAGEFHDFKLPVWMPGYYGLQDYPSKIQDFRAMDAAGRPLPWEKTTDNTWRVAAGGAPHVILAYNVLATSSFVAHSYVGEDRAHLAPCSVFMHLDNRLSCPATVDFIRHPGWNDIATGLDRISPDDPDTFIAPDFDILYDCPVVMGNLDKLPPFEIRGVPHFFIGFALGVADPAQFMKDLKPVIEAGVDIFDEVPYTHYTFLGIGPGMGGIEHLNSAGLGFNAANYGKTREGKLGTLSFLAHEYFHNFNVKRIRPIALGPFDYDKPNRTNMLWVSEGFTSYYEMLMLRRSDTMTEEELFHEIGSTIASVENKTGRLFQSATQSSFESWEQGPFGGRGQGIVKTISYYSKGTVLGVLLDFAIRHESKNSRSLDSVMRTLYQVYYKTMKRGWTDAEFQAECEAAAGASLAEVFSYASTTADIDYAKYLAYAGLEIEPPQKLPEPFLGAIVETDKDGRLLVAATEPDSPARRADLQAGDVLKSFNGSAVAAAEAFNAAVAAAKPEDKVTISLEREGAVREIEIRLDNKPKKTWTIRPIADPDPLQKAILGDWLKIK